MPRNPQSPGRARTIATRSRARRLVAVAAASLLTMLVTAAGAHAQGGAWQSLDSNGDGYYDATAQDSDGNGNFDISRLTNGSYLVRVVPDGYDCGSGRQYVASLPSVVSVSS